MQMQQIQNIEVPDRAALAMVAGGCRACEMNPPTAMDVFTAPAGVSVGSILTLQQLPLTVELS